MKDNGIWYFVANFITYIFMYMLCLMVAIQFVENITIGVVVLFLLLLVCGYVEEKIFSKFVNNFVEKLLKDK